jgi:hypothetical protein
VQYQCATSNACRRHPTKGASAARRQFSVRLATRNTSSSVVIPSKTLRIPSS